MFCPGRYVGSCSRPKEVAVEASGCSHGVSIRHGASCSYIAPHGAGDRRGKRRSCPSARPLESRFLPLRTGLSGRSSALSRKEGSANRSWKVTPLPWWTDGWVVAD
ncbi:hypothetical protein Bca101_095516 [Brassica carinata]